MLPYACLFGFVCKASFWRASHGWCMKWRACILQTAAGGGVNHARGGGRWLSQYGSSQFGEVETHQVFWMKAQFQYARPQEVWSEELLLTDLWNEGEEEEDGAPGAWAWATLPLGSQEETGAGKPAPGAHRVLRVGVTHFTGSRLRGYFQKWPRKSKQELQKPKARSLSM